MKCNICKKESNIVCSCGYCIECMKTEHRNVENFDWETIRNKFTEIMFNDWVQLNCACINLSPLWWATYFASCILIYNLFDKDNFFNILVVFSLIGVGIGIIIVYLFYEWKNEKEMKLKKQSQSARTS